MAENAEQGAAKKTNGIKKNWDSKPPSSDYFIELFRVSKNQIIWGANHFMSKIRKDFSCAIIWDKLDYGSDFADFELAWASFKSAAKSYRQTRQSNQHRSSNPRIHPTQKPIKLYDWIYKNYSNKGEKILDTHLGSGSNAIAAHYFGVGEFVGIELDKDYYKDACKRFDEQTRQLKMF